MCFVYLVVKHGFLFNKYVVAIGQAFCYLYIVSYLSLDTNVGYDSHARFSIDTWQIASVRVAIRIAVLYIENVDEVDSIF